jgi:Phage derived protein Gp49-like (DUF891)
VLAGWNDRLSLGEDAAYPFRLRPMFVFDPWRSSILLVVGDKAGRRSRWYAEAIPLAERRDGSQGRRTYRREAIFAVLGGRRLSRYSGR